MSPKKPATAREVRSFGVFMLVALAAVAWLGRRKGWPVEASFALAAVGAALAVLSMAAPDLARPVRAAWMALGHAMGRVTTPIVLTAIFVLVFVPVRALLALLGKDPLSLRLDPRAKTYWVERDKRAFARDDFERLG